MTERAFLADVRLTVTEVRRWQDQRRFEGKLRPADLEARRCPRLLCRGAEPNRQPRLSFIAGRRRSPRLELGVGTFPGSKPGQPDTARAHDLPVERDLPRASKPAHVPPGLSIVDLDPAPPE